MSFPRQYARTQRFTLGNPRNFRVSPDGQRVVFLRSGHGTDPVTCLWQAQATDDGPWQERLLLDPRQLADTDGDIPPEERARRERARETGSGVVGYTVDSAVTRAVCTLAGRLYLVELLDTATSDFPAARELPAAAPVVDPMLSPGGDAVAYVHQSAIHILDLATGTDRVLAQPDRDQVTWGLADFIAAEEMGRFRGMWWAPDGSALLAARVDTTPVRRWHIADPAEPEAEPQSVPYPAAGTANADVSLAVLPLSEPAEPVWVKWDTRTLPYLVSADWGRSQVSSGPVIVVQSRDQRTLHLLAVDHGTGATSALREETAPDWVEIMPGVPAFTGEGALVWIGAHSDTQSLYVDSQVVTPPELYVRSVLDVDGGTVLFAASAEPTEVDLWSWTRSGARQLTASGGVHGGRLSGGTLLVQRRTLDSCAPHTAVTLQGAEVFSIASRAETPDLPPPNVTLSRCGDREIRTAVVLPSWHEPGSGPLPVLMDPYGGPHAQRVLAAGAAYLSPRWFAEQGFAVVVADGRGSPARGLEWETAIRGDLAGPPLEDQVAALHDAAQRCGDLDLGRVAIRGWSFGGYLAALAVLRRPDVFHAAVAGAPVVDWRLYDTHYTERYLGMPEENPEDYEHSSLIADAGKLSRPLMLIHGLADDNVVFAHTQRLSSALLAAGRPHTVLPLSGITHMASDEAVAESLLLLQVDFLRQALGNTPR